MATKTTTKKKKSRGKIKSGMVFIKSTYNNTLISLTDTEGNLIAQSSAGRVGFSGARKSTPYAAQQAVEDLIERTKSIGMQEAVVTVKGIGGAREAAVRALGAAGIAITAIRDITPIPHNGVRPRKRRRV